MATLGIDFGTTNTVVALHDRGNFPVVGHSIQTRVGQVNHETFPSVAYQDTAAGKLSFGWEAERDAQRSSEGVEIRSLKRLLSRYAEGMRLPGSHLLVKNVLVDLLKSLRESIRRSRLFTPNESLDCVITWPAHANGAQRALTREAFREAGFTVIGGLSEPTAAAIEYADRVTGGNPRTSRSFSDVVAVYDFGGGTFDASVLSIDKGTYRVLDTMGLDDTGGDDLDDVLVAMFCEKLKLDLKGLPQGQRAALQTQARALKEGLSTRTGASLMLNPADVGLIGSPALIKPDDYLARIRPTVARTIDRTAELLERTQSSGLLPKGKKPTAIYLVGGSSRLALVQALVSERFPQLKVITSHKPFSSIAVGAAIAASRRVEVRDIFSRHFGVIRLMEEGKREYFHTIFPAGTSLPRKGQPTLSKTARYSPRHNIGHLRFLECTELTGDGQPKGQVRHWSDVLFPYDPTVAVDSALTPDGVRATEDFSQTLVEEHYSLDSDGIITVELNRQADGHRRRFEISREM